MSHPPEAEIQKRRQAWDKTRRTKAQNVDALRARGDSVDSFLFRDAEPDDVMELAQLHVTTWNAAYNVIPPDGPSVATRAWQWNRMFHDMDGSWFCLLVVHPDGRLVGFTRCNRAKGADAKYEGVLSKIYLLPEYQRLGLGRTMMGLVARRFLAMGVSSFCLFAEADNPTCWFYEALEGERMYNDTDGFDGGYAWRDLNRLAELCPVEGMVALGPAPCTPPTIMSALISGLRTLAGR